MNVCRFVRAARDVTDRAQIHDDRAMDLRELLCVELPQQLLERHAHDCFARLARVVTPGDRRVLLFGAQKVDVVDRNETHGLSNRRAQPTQRRG
jgi:hypothetical protein